MFNDFEERFSNVLVIGSGGAGLRAAIECKELNLSVTVLGKRQKEDVHTGLAAGGINAAFGNVDHEDTWKQHFADTFLEGYEIGDIKIIEIMAKEAPLVVKEIDNWGANFAKLENGNLDQRFFGAHTFRRTCYSGDFTGKSILRALIDKTISLGIPIYDHHYVAELLVKDNTCYGAISIDIKNHKILVDFADAVILAAGGHTRIWSRSSSRKRENTGDGLYLGLKAGCKLIDMEMVQFHPTGITFPDEIAGQLVTEAVRGEGGKLINNKGERFMKYYDKERMELSTRDRVAMANYIEIKEGRGSENGGVYLDISHKEKNFILEKIPQVYKQFLEYQNLDISQEAMEVAPTAHYSMGGLIVTPEEHWTGVKGLYACGEVTGGLHGANRLGGNSLAEILVFGRRAGIAAANYSKRLVHKKRDHSDILKSISFINKFIKEGDEIGIEIENKLYKIMWDFCGVIRDKRNLKLGLREINKLKERMNRLNVKIDSKDYYELIVAFDLKSSILSAEATLLSALKREESRGAHYRNDFPQINNEECYNLHVNLNKNGEIQISKFPIKKLNGELKDIVSATIGVRNFKGRLLE